jgi:surface polysaccharide O-acyltransferase-like enzyme
MSPAPSPARNASLDALRVLCLLGVVTLHVASGGFAHQKAVGFVVDELSRFAVPVFFLLSAYFWKDADLASPLRLAGKVARRVLPAFAAIVAVTVALRLLDGAKPGFELSPGGVALLLWTGGPAFHLWFLPALVVGSALVALLIRWFGIGWALVAALVLFVVGAMLGGYAKLWLGHGFPFWVDRNGIFFAPVFLVGGVLLRQRREAIVQLPVVGLSIAVAVFALLQMAEGYFVVGRFPMGHDYSLATLGYGFAVALLFMRLTLRGAGWSVLGQATFGAYLIHLLVLDVLAGELKLGGNSWLMIALGFGVSLGLAVAARGLRERWAEARA